MMMQQMATDIRDHGWENFLKALGNAGPDFLEFLRSGCEDVVDLMKVLAEIAQHSKPSLEAHSCKWHVHKHTPRCSDK